MAYSRHGGSIMVIWHYGYGQVTKGWYIPHEPYEKDKPPLPHRDDDLPAIEYANGTLEWYYKGKLSRKNAPAIIRQDGSKEYYIFGIRFTEEEFFNLTDDHIKNLESVQ